jgi:glycosyltransferase involved in cell wall biosynthesis
VRVSVVVPAFNEEALLPGSLAATRAAMGAFEDGELIVCDNNSTDRTAEIARAAGAKVVFEPVNQISRARNTGAAAASGDWLVFVDADSYPTIELFREAGEAMKSGCLAGGATVTFETRDRVIRAWIAAWNALSRIGRWAAGSFIFCEAAAFRELGGFSQDLYAAEELDLFKRLKRVARRQRREIVILHRHPLRTSDRKARLYTKREHFAFMLKTVLLAGRNLRNRESCYAWYDGRR